MRGFAILEVLSHQLCIDGFPLGRTLRLFLAPFQAGWVGVQLFFVLSGFLITGILVDTRDAKNYWASFFARRVLRIVPLYYTLLLLTFVIVPRLVCLPTAVVAQHRNQLWYWLYAANWQFVTEGYVDSLGHCWSLAVEEQFYLLWPFAVRFLPARRLVTLCLALVVGSFLLRLGLRLSAANPEWCYELTLARLDALALGAGAAIVIRQKQLAAFVVPRLPALMKVSLGALGLVTLISGGLARRNIVTQTVGYTLVGLASTALITRVALGGARGGATFAVFSSPLLRRFGRYSYGIYVWHFPLHLIVARTLILPRLAHASEVGFVVVQSAYFFVGTCVLFLVGYLSYNLLERRFLGLKHHFAARVAID